MVFSQTEVKVFEIVNKNDINLVESNLDRLDGKEDKVDRFVDGLFAISLLRTLKQSNVSVLKDYSDWIESGMYSAKELESIFRAVFVQLKNMSERDRNHFVKILQKNLENVFREFMNELDKNYGILDILSAYPNPNALPAKIFFENNSVNFYNISVPHKLAHHIFNNPTDIWIDLPGRKGLFNKPEIELKILPYKIQNTTLQNTSEYIHV
ncbi:MAG: hypothetical protein NZ908_02840 [Candidatus Micrarchaeota archaeon]|nr:hypothetical protein [Candidatus Micrarchaeota archaeon]